MKVVAFQRGIIAIMKIKTIARWLVFLLFLATLLTLSTPSFSTPAAVAGRFTRAVEFDYFSWDVNAFFTKLEQTGLDPKQVITADQQKQMIWRYLYLTNELAAVKVEVQQIYADPHVKDAEKAAKSALARQAAIQAGLDDLTPLAESILEGQVAQVIVESGFSRLGNTIPPLLFHTTDLPKALILSPRDNIQQDANISLLADLPLDKITQLEEQVEAATGESALVVDVGGIGIYPTMVMRSTNLPWIIDTIVHEWTHNYLVLRPLGLSYDLSPELRTMNETTAAIVGGEISNLVLEKYYPEFTAQPTWGRSQASLRLMTDQFDFRAEMHATRVHVDELLAQGKIEEAEQYMEERRILFVNNGYSIRKLNQAYFAFHGAYADQPGGAAGEDPVGPAVRTLRAQSESLADFLRTIGKMNSYDDLLKAISQDQSPKD